AAPPRWAPQGHWPHPRGACPHPRAEMVEKMRILIDAGEGLHERAPHSALPDHVLKAARSLQTPIGETFDPNDPRAAILKQLLGALAQIPDSPLTPPVIPPRNAYFDQFQRTAAELLVEFRKDPEALAELDAYAAGRRTDVPSRPAP
ncbi:MAG: hypothetical protein P4L84_15045, partial [Isosphaeraceae bacterium]|nr:hypothetical protein [Isosphaeraceae bacterium]